MSYFAVIREAGPAWTDGKALLEQPGIDDHAAFMNGLADEGSVVLAGPLAGTEHGRLRALLILSADGEAEIHRRLADDPWALTQQLEITSIEPWSIFVGADRVRLGSPAEGVPEETSASGTLSREPRARPVHQRADAL